MEDVKWIKLTINMTNAVVCKSKFTRWLHDSITTNNDVKFLENDEYYEIAMINAVVLWNNSPQVHALFELALE